MQQLKHFAKFHSFRVFFDLPKYIQTEECSIRISMQTKMKMTVGLCIHLRLSREKRFVNSLVVKVLDQRSKDRGFDLIAPFFPNITLFHEKVSYFKINIQEITIFIIFYAFFVLFE